MSAVVVFGISPGVSEQEVEELLGAVATFNGVIRTERLTSTTGNADAVRHCISTVAASVAAQDIVNQILGLPGIEYADLAADRGFTS